MVAYSFHRVFAADVAGLIKRQTVRADRNRHAQPGEPVQLFAGMRTRSCVKLVTPDPICVSVPRIEVTFSNLISDLIASVTIDGFPLDRTDIEEFAHSDGFGPEGFPPAIFVHGRSIDMSGYRTARGKMGAYWQATHGLGRFEGVVVKWGRPD